MMDAGLAREATRAKTSLQTNCTGHECGICVLRRGRVLILLEEIFLRSSKRGRLWTGSLPIV